MLILATINITIYITVLITKNLTQKKSISDATDLHKNEFLL